MTYKYIVPKKDVRWEYPVECEYDDIMYGQRVRVMRFSGQANLTGDDKAVKRAEKLIQMFKMWGK